jgi:hypothetical protein
VDNQLRCLQCVHFKSSEMVLKYEETTWLERPFEESEVLEP